jgi:hypothetical protein
MNTSSAITYEIIGAIYPLIPITNQSAVQLLMRNSYLRNLKRRLTLSDFTINKCSTRLSNQE